MELKSIGEQLQEIENELSNLPTPEEYETVEKFAEQIRQRIGEEGWDIQPQEKRRVLELLHTKVWIGLDYTVRVTGWFGETEGFTYKSRSRFAPRTRSAHKAELQFALRQNHAVRNHNSRYRLHTSILSGPGDISLYPLEGSGAAAQLTRKHRVTGLRTVEFFTVVFYN